MLTHQEGHSWVDPPPSSPSLTRLLETVEASQPFTCCPAAMGVEAAHRQFTQMIPTNTQTGLTSLVNWSMKG